jgi:hypothetical protein
MIRCRRGLLWLLSQIPGAERIVFSGCARTVGGFCGFCPEFREVKKS